MKARAFRHDLQKTNGFIPSAALSDSIDKSAFTWTEKHLARNKVGNKGEASRAAHNLPSTGPPFILRQRRRRKQGRRGILSRPSPMAMPGFPVLGPINREMAYDCRCKVAPTRRVAGARTIPLATGTTGMEPR